MLWGAGYDEGVKTGQGEMRLCRSSKQPLVSSLSVSLPGLAAEEDNSAIGLILQAP